MIQRWFTPFLLLCIVYTGFVGKWLTRFGVLNCWVCSIIKCGITVKKVTNDMRLFSLILLYNHWRLFLCDSVTCGWCYFGNTRVSFTNDSSMPHYDDVIMGAMASQITSLTIVYSTVYSGADQSKHQSSASLAFVWGIHRGPVNFPHKWPFTRKMFPFDDVMISN